MPYRIERIFDDVSMPSLPESDLRGYSLSDWHSVAQTTLSRETSEHKEIAYFK